jgi:PAS domain S-box-containing protein
MDIRVPPDDPHLLCPHILDAAGCVIIVSEVGTGVIVSMNRVAERVTGHSRQDMLGQPVWNMTVPPVDRATAAAAYAIPGAAGVPLAYEGDVVTRSGSVRPVFWSNAFISDDAGVRTHMVSTGIDVSGGRDAVGVFSLLMRSATTTAFIGTDMDARVTYFSLGAEQMFGRTAHQMLGRPLPDDFFDPDALRARAAALGVPPVVGRLLTLIEGPPGEAGSTASQHDWPMVRSDGTRLIASIEVSPVTDANGIQVGFLGMVRDVTHERGTDALLASAVSREEEAVRRVRELERAKSDFIATVSHELRTPMTSIAGYTELLAEGVDGTLSPRQKEHVDAVRRNGKRLIALADDLLTLSGFDDDGSTLAWEDVDLCDVVTSARKTLDPLVAKRRLDLTFAAPDRPVVVRGDRVQLARVVFNLVSNAIKFTEDGGVIRCELGVDSGEAVLEVRDNGIGIPRGEQGKLFTRFFRSTSARKGAMQGTGVGLAIVASVLQEHGGTISVVSDHRCGARFVVRLPLAATSRRPRVDAA